MKTGMRGWMLVCSLLLIAALFPSVAGAAGEEVTQVEFTMIKVPYVGTEIPSASNASLHRSKTDSVTGAEDNYNSADDGWYNASTDHGPIMGESGYYFQEDEDYYLRVTAMGPKTNDYFPVSFNKARVKFSSSVKVKPYKIEAEPNGLWCNIKLYYHSYKNYTMYSVPDNIWFKQTGIFAEEVYEGDVPSKEYEFESMTRPTDFTISNVQWHEVGSTAAVKTFSAEKNYQVSCELTADEYYAEFGTTDLSLFKGYLFAGGTYGYDTNINAEWVSGKEGKSLKLTYYPKTATRISKVSLGSIQTPVPGETPQTVGFTADKKAVKVALLKWQDAEGKPVTTFEYKDTYTLWLKLTLEAGYTFYDKMTAADVELKDCTGTLSGFQWFSPDATGIDEYHNTLFIAVQFKTGKPPESPTPPAAPTSGSYTAPDGNTYNLAGNGTATFQKPNGSASDVTIPATITVGGQTINITAIADKAFYKNTKLKKVTIGKNIKTIGKSAFEGCTKLAAVKGGTGIVTIKDKAFKSCKALTAFIFNTKVTKIGKSAFEGCKKLKTITFKTTKLTKAGIGKNSFKGIYAKPAVKCPKAQKKNYKTWLIKVGKMPSKAQFK